jgi:hypothetical protein
MCCRRGNTTDGGDRNGCQERFEQEARRNQADRRKTPPLLGLF